MLSGMFIAALWSRAGKGLTSWLLFVMFNCVFVTFPCGILGQVWYSIPDLCRISFFISPWSIVTANLISEGSNQPAHFIIKSKYPFLQVYIIILISGWEIFINHLRDHYRLSFKAVYVSVHESSGETLKMRKLIWVVARATSDKNSCTDTYWHVDKWYTLQFYLGWWTRPYTYICSASA